MGERNILLNFLLLKGSFFVIFLLIFFIPNTPPTVLPNIHPFSFDGEANSGDSIQLTCHVSKGDLPLVIKWTHNGKPIYSHSGVLANKIGDRISLLTISSVEAQHSGIFTCVASNVAGKVNFSAELFVNGL